MSKTPETLTFDECEKLLATLKQTFTGIIQNPKNQRNYTMALFMLDAGLRVGEVTKLEIRDLFINGQPVNSLCVRKEISKTKSERIVPLSLRLQIAVMDYSKLLPNASVLLGQRPFFSHNDFRKTITPRQVQRIIASASLQSIGREIHPHVLRHTFATRLMRITSTPVIQQLLGHKCLTSTQVYLHPNGDDFKKAIDAL